MRIVIKVGTSTLAYSTGLLNIRRVEELCRAMSDLKNAGNEVILISSGAIGMGVGKLGLKKRPTDIPTKQAAAAVGQCELMYIYDKLFGEYNHTVAQILLTKEDVENETRRENFKNTMFRLLELDALPVINENDTVATDEIVIGDNDTLGAIVAANVDADLLAARQDAASVHVVADDRHQPHVRAQPRQILADVAADAAQRRMQCARVGIPHDQRPVAAPVDVHVRPADARDVAHTSASFVLAASPLFYLLCPQNTSPAARSGKTAAQAHPDSF